MNKIEIFRGTKEIFLATIYQLESESYITSKPIYCINTEAKKELFKEKIKHCLKSSKVLSEKEEDNYWLSSTELLKSFKTKSFNTFYKKHVGFSVYLEDENIVCKEYKHLGVNKGLELKEDYVSFPYSSNDSLMKVIEYVLK